MTDLLKQAFELASSLPPREQDFLASLVMDEMKSEARWQELFDQSGDILDLMAEEALKEHRDGKTLPLDPESI
jgi:hypothetical protein